MFKDKKQNLKYEMVYVISIKYWNNQSNGTRPEQAKEAQIVTML